MFQLKKFLFTFAFVACTIYQLTSAEEVATYEEVKDLPNHPEKWLIDVRSREMVSKDGSIPTSINIPLAELESGLKMDDGEFKQKYGRDKPPKDATVIFTCLEGSFAQKGSDLAKSMGWANAKPYLGSWLDWTLREGL